MLSLLCVSRRDVMPNEEVTGSVSFITVSYDTNMPANFYHGRDADMVENVFSPVERAREKQASRDRGIARLEAGEISAEELARENAFFAKPGMRARLIARRVRIKLPS